MYSKILLKRNKRPVKSAKITKIAGKTSQKETTVYLKMLLKKGTKVR